MKKKQGKKLKFNKSRIIFLALILFIVIIAGSSIKQIIVLHIENNKLLEEKQKLNKEKEKVKKEEKEINNPEYLEEQARKQLKLIKPGEHLYIIDEKK